MNPEPVITVAGNPNAGKTTIFNALTGSRQHTGNWPGVTVEKKYGFSRIGDRKCKVVDLPGTYGLSAHSLDESVARDFLLSGESDVVVIVVDATLLDRHLYLVTQCLEMGLNIVLCLNMMDSAEEAGIRVDFARLSGILGIPVVPCVAVNNQGLDELRDAISGALNKPDGAFRVHYGEDLERYIEEITEKVSDIGVPYPSRWVALQFLEEDAHALDLIHLVEGGRDLRRAWIEGAINLCQTLGYDDLPTLLAEKRYGFVHGVVKECVSRQSAFDRIDWTRRIDTVLTNPFVGMPIFFVILWLSFQLVFTLGNPVATALDVGLSTAASTISGWFYALHLHPFLISFLTHGVISGVGSVLVFLPNIMILFFLIAILEDSGYMARAAYIMDRLMHTMGLHGKSFLPMILGFGCNVPAIMGSRILESEKDRTLTILILPLMSCSARLPIYILFTGIFFQRHQGLVVFSLYLIGVILAIIVARIFQKLFFRNETAPLVMELPPYHMPSVRGAAYHMWLRSRLFVRKAGTVILAGVVLIWFLASFPPGVSYASPESWIGKIGDFLAPLLAPAGFGFGEAAIALLSGVVAKEIVVGTLGTLYGDLSLNQALASHFTHLSAYAFMLMSLIYVPCLSTLAVIRREIGVRWALLTITYTSILGWLIATLVYQVGSLFL